MSLLEYVDSLPITQALGWTLVHFLWQGALLVGLVWGVLQMLQNRNANSRYLVCCAGMVFMITFPLVTFLVIIQTSSKPIAEAAVDLFLLDLGTMGIWPRLSVLMPWLTVFWLTGTLLFQGRMVLNWSKALRIKHHGVRRAPSKWQRTLQEMCKNLKVHSKVRLIESSLARVPMVMGWLRPVIIVPAYALTGLTPEQLRTVLAHELAHVRRHDYLVNMIQALFESLLFYHPAVWWLSSRLRVEREFCCDDVAVRYCRDPLCYAKALSSLDDLRDAEVQAALATTGGPLMKRIFRIVGVPLKSSHRLGGWIAPVVITLSMTGVVWAMSYTPAASSNDFGNKKDPVLLTTPLDPQEEVIEEIVEIEEVIEEKKHPQEDELLLKKKEEELLKKMKAEGKSKEEIKKALMKLRKKMGLPPTKASEEKILLKKKEEDLIKKMTAAGKSKKEIQKAITELRETSGLYVKPSDKELLLKKKEEDLIKKMTAAGKSKKEIQKAITDLRENSGLYMKSREKEFLLQKKETDLVKKMKAAGKSDAEIKKAVREMYKEMQINEKDMPSRKKKDVRVKKIKAEYKSDT